MSFLASDPGVDVGGISVVNNGGVGGAPAVAGVHAADVLAFTGTGPGTLPLAIAGVVSLAGGLLALAVRRRRDREVSAPRDGLADLSALTPAAPVEAARTGPAAALDAPAMPLRWRAPAPAVRWQASVA